MAIVSLSCSEGLTSVVKESIEDPVEVAEASALIPGEMILEFSDETVSKIEAALDGGYTVALPSSLTKSALGEDVASALGVTSLRRLYPDAGEWEPRHRAAGLHRWYRMSYDPQVSLTKASVSLSSLDGVVYSEPARRLKGAEAVFDDPELSKQWHYDNPSTGSYNALADINVVPVWKNFSAGSGDVIVAVVDGGVDLTHPDLDGVVIAGGPEGSKNFVTGYTGYSISATTHGTHVAGTIAAVNNNGAGVCGVAGGRDGKGGVKILSCQIFSDKTDSDGNSPQGDSYNAMVWGADHGAVISQNSWGYVYESALKAKQGSVGSMKAAIDYFVKYAGCDSEGNQLPTSPMKGGVVIFAAGNEAWPDAWPAEYEGVIAVGAINATLSRSSYSNYGDWVDICAPGGDSVVDPMILSTLPDGKYGYLQGTSMACPHVSGVAALLVSYFGGQGFTNKMLTERLLGGANGGTSLEGQKIGPLLDAYGAFMYGGTVAPERVEDFNVEPSSNNLTFTWNVTADSDSQTGAAYAYLLLASKSESDFASLDLRNLPSGMVSRTMEVEDEKVGGSISGVISGLDFETPYYTAIVGYDFSKNYSAMSPVKKVTTFGNHPPVIETDAVSPVEIKAFETKSFNFSVYDPDGHQVGVKYTPGGSADSWREDGEGGWQLIVVGKNAPEGNYCAEVRATDAAGEGSLTTTFSLNYTILPNNAPVKIKDLKNRLMSETGISYKIDMTEYVCDPDGETLSYSVSHTNQSVAHINPVGNTLTVTSLNYGVDEISVRASDCMGESCTLSFKVCVRKDAAGVDVYPTSVKDFLYVSTVSESSLEVEIVNSAGKTVAGTGGTADIFNPLRIDLSACARGLYTVVVTSGGVIVKRTVSKL